MARGKRKTAAATTPGFVPGTDLRSGDASARRLGVGRSPGGAAFLDQGLAAAAAKPVRAAGFFGNDMPRTTEVVPAAGGGGGGAASGAALAPAADPELAPITLADINRGEPLKQPLQTSPAGQAACPVRAPVTAAPGPAVPLLYCQPAFAPATSPHPRPTPEP